MAAVESFPLFSPALCSLIFRVLSAIAPQTIRLHPTCPSAVPVSPFTKVTILTRQVAEKLVCRKGIYTFATCFFRMTVIVTSALLFLINSCCVTAMDLFTQLNYSYPGTSNAASLHVFQQPQGHRHRVSVPNIQSTGNQNHPGDGYAHPMHSHSHSRSSLDFTGHGLRPQQNSTLVDSRGSVHPDPKRPMKMYYTDEPANLPDQYIPSSNDKITCTDHRPLDEIFGNMRPLTGLSGLPHPSPNGTPHGNPLHTSVLTYALPTKPQLDGVIHIPLLAVDNQMSGTGLVVDFRCSDWGIGIEIEGMSSCVDLACALRGLN